MLTCFAAADSSGLQVDIVFKKRLVLTFLGRYARMLETLARWDQIRAAAGEAFGMFRRQHDLQAAEISGLFVPKKRSFRLLVFSRGGQRRSRRSRMDVTWNVRPPAERARRRGCSFAFRLP